MKIGKRIGRFSTPEVETTPATPVIIPVVKPAEVPDREKVEVEIQKPDKEKEVNK